MPEFAGLVPAVSKGQMAEPFYTEERCSISEFMNTPEVANVSLAQACVAPGITTQLHSLAIEERYIIQQGRGLMEVDEHQAFAVGVGDIVVIPAGVAQRIRNVLDEDLKFLCVCTPRFEPEHYKVLETVQTPPLDIAL